MRKKLSIIGAGHVGATVAQYAAEQELADIVLVDIADGLPQGTALDLCEAGPVRGFGGAVRGAGDFADTRDSDVIVITAGRARTPGMSRDDLLAQNARIISTVTAAVAPLSPRAICIVVTNPLDVMTHLCWKTSGFDHARVVGMAGVLDAGRLAAFVSMELAVSVKDIRAMVLGGHGDSMVPLPRYTTVSGVPLTALLPAARIDALVERTRKAGGEIVGFLKTGSAYYSPGASAALMAASVLRDEKRLLPCAAYLTGAYGLRDVYIGVPVILGAGGVEKIIELPLTADESRALARSADEVAALVKKLKI